MNLDVETRRPSGSPVAYGGKPAYSTGLTSRLGRANPPTALAQISRLYKVSGITQNHFHTKIQQRLTDDRQLNL